MNAELIDSRRSVAKSRVLGISQLADVPMNAELIDSRRSVAKSRVLGMKCKCASDVRRTADLCVEMCKVKCRILEMNYNSTDN